MNPHHPHGGRLAMLIAMGAALGVAVAAPFTARGWVVGLAATVAVVEADLMWRVVRVERRWRWARARRIAVELAVLWLVIRFAQLAAAGWSSSVAEVRGWPQGFVNGEAALAFAVAVGVWIAVSATMDDLARVGELSTAMDEEILPIPRLHRRFMSGGLVLVAAGAVGLVGWEDLVDVGRSMAPGILWPALTYFPLGIVGLGRVRRADATRRWQRQHVDVQPGVLDRWAWGIAAMTALMLAVVVLAPSGDGAPIVRLGGGLLALIGRLGQSAVEWLTRRRAEPESEDLPETPTPEPGLELPEAPEQGIEPGSPLFSPELTIGLQRTMLWLAIGVVVLVAGREVWRARSDLAEIVQRVRRDHGVVAAIRALVGRIVRAILDGLSRLIGRRPEGEEPPATRARWRPGKGRRRAASEWQPQGADAQRVVRAYRRFREAASDLVVSRPNETPTEHLLRLTERRPDLEEGGRPLTRLYEEVRYSDHMIGPTHASEADRQLDQVLAVLAE